MNTFFEQFDKLPPELQTRACDVVVEGERGEPFSGVARVGCNLGERSLYIDSGAIVGRIDLSTPLYEMTQEEVEGLFPEVSSYGLRRETVIKLWEKSQVGTGDDLSPMERVAAFYERRREGWGQE
jgi:hypothetical protein